MPKPKELIKIPMVVSEVTFEIKIPKMTDKKFLKLAADCAQLVGFAGFKSKVVEDDCIIYLSIYPTQEERWEQKVQEQISNMLWYHNLETPWLTQRKLVAESYREWCKERGEFP